MVFGIEYEVECGENDGRISTKILEAGFRDVKRALGFAKARIKEIKAWTKMFRLQAIAMLVLASVERAHFAEK